MPVTVSHALSATTPDNPSYEIRPSHWNSNHDVVLNAVGSEISGAFSNGGNVAFALETNGFITASANVTAAPSPVVVTGVNGSSVAAQTIAFSQGNGMTLGVSTAANGATVTGSYTVPTVPTSYVSNINGSSGAVSMSVGSSLSMSTNGSSITWGLASNITTALQSAGAYLTTAALSNHSHGDPQLNLTNLSGTTASNSAGFTLSLSAVNALTTAALSNHSHGFSAPGGSSAFQTLTFANSFGVSWSNSNGSVVGSVNTTYAASNHSHGNPTLALTNLTGTTASASNGFTLSLSAAAPGAAAANINLLGANTAGNTTASGSTIGWSGVNVTLSGTNNSQIVVSGPASSSLSGTGALSISANGDTISIGVPNLSIYASSNTTGQSSSSSYAIGSLSLRAMGNMSIGHSGGEVIFSCAAGGADGGIFASAAGSSQSAGNIVWSNSNGVSFGMNGSTITASHNGLTSQSNQNVTAGNGGFAYQTLSFSNVNGISFGTSAGSAITASHNAITTGRASNDAIGTNTAQSNVTWTVNSSGLSLDARGYAGTATGFTGANISGTFTHNSVGLSMSLSVAAPGAAAESNAMHLLGANTAGNTTATGSTIGWSGINVTLSGTNNSVINISAPATSSLVGASGITISTAGSTISVGQKLGSFYGNMEGEWVNSTVLQPLQSTSHIQPFVVENPISFGFIRLMVSGGQAASSTGNTTGNSQFSYGQTRSHNFVLYSRGTGANSMSLQSVLSTQLTDQQSHNVSAAANSTQFSYSNRFSYQMSTGTTGFTYDYSSSAASLNFHISGMSAVTGQKVQEFPWAGSVEPGQYWLMYGVSSSTQSQYTNQGTRFFNLFSNYGQSGPNIAFGPIGANTNSSVGPYLGQGSFSTAGGGTTASLPISAVSTSGSHNKMFFQLGRIA